MLQVIDRTYPNIITWALNVTDWLWELVERETVSLTVNEVITGASIIFMIVILRDFVDKFASSAATNVKVSVVFQTIIVKRERFCKVIVISWFTRKLRFYININRCIINNTSSKCNSNRSLRII